MRVLIAGGGHVGALTARRLTREGNEVVIVERDPERCAELQEKLDVKVVRGSATSISTLRDAGLTQAKIFIAVTNSDEVNVVACLAVQAGSKNCVKMARIRTHEFEHWQHVIDEAGIKIDLVIHPETEIMERILRVAHLPRISDVIDFAGGDIKLFGMNVERSSWISGKTLEELDRAGPPKDSLIALIFRGQQVIIPHGAQVLQPGDHIYIIATKDNLQKVMVFMGLAIQQQLRRAIIIGGKQVGIWVAEALEKQGVNVKIIERDPDRCELIAGILDNTIVIHGDGTDQLVLEEENIEGVDTFLALTNDDEDNIIASLLARRLGARKVIALINRLNYLSMVERLGISTSVSPRLVAVDRILQFVRKGRVLSVTTFREEEAEAIELIATENSEYVGKKLRDVRLPRGAIVGAIARPNGEVTVPRGDAVIAPGDHIVLFTLESVIAQLETSFLVEDRKENS